MPCRVVEQGTCRPPYPRPIGVRGGAAQAPERAAPPVTEARRVLPAAVVAKTVVEAPVLMRVRGEREERLLQPGEFRPRFPAEYHQAARHVVEAVAVLAARQRSGRVLEQADIVGHAQQVSIVQPGGCHATTGVGLRTRPSASLRYWMATDAQPSVCAAARAALAIPVAT